MKFKLLILLAFLVFSSNISAQKKEDFIGYKHKGVVYGKTLPNGLKDLGGGLLTNDVYGVSRFSKGNKIYLWLERIVDRDTKGVPNWVVKDFLTFDKLEKNQEFMYSLSSTCTIKGKLAYDFVVMTEFVPKNKSYKILKAWKANTRTEKFEKITTKGVKCQYIQP